MLLILVTISLLFNALSIHSSDYDPEEINLAHITIITQTLTEETDKYIAELGPIKDNDRIYACKNNKTGRFNCWRVCKKPENRTILPSSYFDLIKTKCNEQKSIKN